jgi:hypothetical protein
MKKEKLIISESLPQQALASLSTAVGSSFETLGNLKPPPPLLTTLRRTAKMKVSR